MRRVVALAVIAAVATTSASARVGVQRGFPAGECTTWAYAKRPAIVDLTVLRNLTVKSSTYQATETVSDWSGWLWAANARKGGFAVGTRPAAGAIAVWPRNTDGAGPIGHVAYVEQVLAGGAFAVSEQNWAGRRHATRRVVPRNPSLRFVYRRSDEPRRAGTGRLLRLSGTQGPDGKTPSVTLRMSGRADVLLHLLGPHGLANESARIVPAGTSAVPLSEIAQGADLAAGNYTVVVVVVGGGGDYRYLPLYVPGP